MVETKDAAAATIAIFAILLPFLFALWAASETGRFTTRTILAVFTLIAVVLGLALYLVRK